MTEREETKEEEVEKDMGKVGREGGRCFAMCRLD